MKVAIIHYWLVGMRGGERVVEALAELYPQADIYTHVCAPERISDELRQHRIETTFISRLPGARRWYNRYLPLMPLALEQLDLSGYDLIISSESGPAKGVIVPPEATHVCYCHSPMRYIWDRYHEYRSQAGLLTRWMMPLTAHYLRTWDVASAARVGTFVANSRFVSCRIQQYYHRQSTVIHPPVDVDALGRQTGEPTDEPTDEPGDFYLYVGQLVGYKGVEMAVETFNRLQRRLVVIGEGPLLQKLRSMAGDTVEVMGWQPDEVVHQMYRTCRALVFPGVEDFGIVPVEAMASGRPVLALDAGGARETVMPGISGMLFTEPTPQSLMDCVADFEKSPDFDPEKLRMHAQQFSRDRFKREFQDLVEGLIDGEHRK
ncbi:MAG: glycosyltransferase [Gemmatimonadetes bacterium]|nr:glycosyltransferase [Gemmatimonadota bacterium]